MSDLAHDGTLDGAALASTLRAVSGTEQHGLLAIQGDHDLVSVSFRAGTIVAADSMNHPASERLGEVLANQGVLSPAQFTAALETDADSGKLASEVLLEARLVEEEQLLAAVRQQSYRQVLEVLRWESGNFHFTPGVEGQFQAGVEPISVAELLLRASDDLGAEGPLSGAPPDLDTVFEAAPEPSGDVRVLGIDGDREDDSPGVIWLTQKEQRLLQAVDGQQPASLFLLEPGFDPYEVKYALHSLAERGLIQVSLQAPESSSLHSGVTSGVGQHILTHQVAPAEEAEGPGEGMLSLDEQMLEQPSEAASGWGDLARPPVEPRESRASERSLLELVPVLLARCLALGFAGLTVLALFTPTEPGSLWFPYPWLEPERGMLEQNRRLAHYGKIDRAVRTYYLLFGRYPEELGLLTDLELMAQRDLYDADGSWLAYSSDRDGYVLQPVRAEASTGFALAADVKQDFLLNPRFIDPSERASRSPIVLLD